jgi:hypothetical protein
MAKSENLLQGTLDLLILHAAANVASAAWLRHRADHPLALGRGTESGRRLALPALYRLELDDLISAKWGLSENNRKAKYYSITRRGTKALNEQQETWGRLSAAVGRVLAR